MAGTEISLLDRTLYDFGSALANGAGGDLFYALNVPAVNHVQAFVYVRVHARTMPTGTKLTFRVFSSAPTREDPATSFRTAPLVLTPALEMNPSTAVGALLLASIATPFGPNLDFSVLPTYPTAAGAFNATISVGLVLKS